MKHAPAPGTGGAPTGRVIVTPLTPFVDNPTGRLTELVYLLSDRPLPLVHQAVLGARSGAAKS